MAYGKAGAFLTQEKPFKLSTKFSCRSGSQGDSFRLGGATSGGGGADVSQREVRRAGLEVSPEFLGSRFQNARIRCTQWQQMRSAAIGFFGDHMAVGAAPAEGACAPHRGFPPFRPRFKLGDHSKVRGPEINVRIRRLEIQAGRDLAVVKSKYQLDQPRDAGGSFKVTNIGFHR